MLARLHTLEVTPEQYEATLRIVKDDLLPWARDSTGFCGAIALIDRDSGKALFLTLWSDEETRADSAIAAERMSSLAADVSGTHNRLTENFEVTLFDLVGGAPVAS
jgi:hypothetical protein